MKQNHNLQLNHYFYLYINDDQEDADGDDETHEPGDQDGGQFHQYHDCPKCDIL